MFEDFVSCATVESAQHGRWDFGGYVEACTYQPTSHATYQFFARNLVAVQTQSSPDILVKIISFVARNLVAVQTQNSPDILVKMWADVDSSETLLLVL